MFTEIACKHGNNIFYCILWGACVYILSNACTYVTEYINEKEDCFLRWSMKSHVETSSSGSFRGYTDFHNVLGRNGSEFGLLGKFRDLSSMLRLSSRSRNTASPAYLRKSLAQVSQSYHKTMESRSGNLVNSAKSNSRVASAGVDKVTPFSRSFSLSLSPPLFISLLHHPSLYPVAFLHRNAVSPFIYFFLPSLTLFFSFFSFFFPSPLPPPSLLLST